MRWTSTARIMVIATMRVAAITGDDAKSRCMGSLEFLLIINKSAELILNLKISEKNQIFLVSFSLKPAD